MADLKQLHPRDRDPDNPEQLQPKRAYDQVRDYFTLRRFRFDFGREFNPTNYWKARGEPVSGSTTRRGRS